MNLHIKLRLIELERDRLERELAGLSGEQRRVRQELEVASRVETVPVGSVWSAPGIGEWMRAQEKRRDKKLGLAEKEFAIETRIGNCRQNLLSVHRQYLLWDGIIRHREDEVARSVERKSERNQLEQIAARPPSGIREGMGRGVGVGSQSTHTIGAGGTYRH